MVEWMRKVEMSEKILNDLIGENSHLKKHCSTLEVEVDQLERRLKVLEIENDKLKHDITIAQTLRRKGRLSGMENLLEEINKKKVKN